VVINQLQEGDWVIEGALPRRNQLERADSHNKALAHVFGANVDHLVIVSALRDPVCKPGLIDRYLLIAEIAGVEPTIVLNKTDLADPAPIADLYRGLDYPVFTTDAAAGTGQLEDLRDHLAGGACIFCGQSGVGKSSLIRALYPAFDIRIGAVSEALGKGRHTTTAARSYLVDDHTRLIDTPGIRECGIRADDAPDIALRYRELAPLHRLCQFNDCTHTHEPACAVKLSVADGSVALSRYASYLAMLENDLELPISGSEEVLGDYTEPTDESSEDDGQSNQQGDAQAEAGP
jgi:ribosome biogenesis GTPase